MTTEALDGGRPSVASAMILRPKVCGPAATVADVHALFADDHVHSVLVVDGPTLLTVVDRGDLATARPDAPARESGRLAGRTARPDADLADIRRAMAIEPRRRIAVVDARNTLLGLLCLKRSGRGFCSDADVASRAAEKGRALPPMVSPDTVAPGRGD